MRNVKQRGFTLIELMVALVVLGILLSIGIPSFNSIIESTNLRSVTHSLNSATQLARSEALDRRNEDVAVCRANGAFSACSFGADWSSGWVVVALTGADLETNTDVEVIRVWEAVDITVSGAANGFVFNGSGRAPTNGDLQIQNNTESRCLRVNGSGRAAVVEGGC
ncbi:GspH/FimT family pseudopilin [uncultured Amphritea sp.]|uniref:GspH/FimT family pseudopilin n=1 Tax=uncultured Amphritea sp. TaxID=981605 RepID=UPI0026387B0F|nr:GspH/FimT family pseudopilin [uncultured Amphritea sp.]